MHIVKTATVIGILRGDFILNGRMALRNVIWMKMRGKKSNEESKTCVRLLLSEEISSSDTCWGDIITKLTKGIKIKAIIDIENACFDLLP